MDEFGISQAFCSDDIQVIKNNLSKLDIELAQCFMSHPDSSILSSIRDVFTRSNVKPNQYGSIWEGLPFFSSVLKNNQIIVWDFFFQTVFLRGNNIEFATLLLERELKPSSIDEYLQTHPKSFDTIKGVLNFSLFFCINSETVCILMFEMATYIQQDKLAEYLDYCRKHIYENYPLTSYKTSDNYKNGNPPQKALVDMITHCNDQRSEYLNIARQIPDLMPSEERARDYQRVMSLVQEHITDKANKRSVTLNIFPQHAVKYGKRVGYLYHIANDSVEYISQPFQSISYELELPRQYINDPIQWLVEKESLKRITEIE